MCFNVNRRESTIYLLRGIHARFMKIYVLWVLNVNRRKSIINLCAQHLCDIYVDLRSKRAVRVSPWLNIFNGKTDIINRFL